MKRKINTNTSYLDKNDGLIEVVHKDGCRPSPAGDGLSAYGGRVCVCV